MASACEQTLVAHVGCVCLQISESLARVVRSLSEARQAAERRQPLVAAITDMQHCRAESQWLREYDADNSGAKYKVSGCMCMET